MFDIFDAAVGDGEVFLLLAREYIQMKRFPAFHRRIINLAHEIECTEHIDGGTLGRMGAFIAPDILLLFLAPDLSVGCGCGAAARVVQYVVGIAATFVGYALIVRGEERCGVHATAQGVAQSVKSVGPFGSFCCQQSVDCRSFGTRCGNGDIAGLLVDQAPFIHHIVGQLLFAGCGS